MYDTKSNQLSNLNVSIDKGTNEANASVVVHLPHLMPVARGVIIDGQSQPLRPPTH